MEKQKLFSIYGAKFSKDKARVNISLVCGHEKEKEFANISLKLDSKTTPVKYKDGYFYLKIKELKPSKELFTDDENPF